MKNGDFTQKGGTKKFLYSGPKKDPDEQEDIPWNFGSKNNFTKRSNENSKFELDDVWSIKRNVNVGGGAKEQKADPLAFSTNKSYYSRYGGGSSNASDEKSWNMPAQGHRPFSYSYGTDPNPVDKTSPRNVSMSSTGTYQHSNMNSFGTRYLRSQGSDKTTSNNNALFNTGLSQNGSGFSGGLSQNGGLSSTVGAYPNIGSVTARDGNSMISSGGRNSLQGRYMPTKNSDTLNRSKVNTDSPFNQQNKQFW